MKLKNNALQELYDTLVNCTITISAYVDSPVDKAFRECDEKLSESITFEHIKKLENDNEDLRSANMRGLSKERKLEKDLADAKNQLKYFTQSRDDWRARAKYSEDEVKELKATLEKANADRTELQKDRDSYHGLYTELRKDYDKLFEDNKRLKARTDCHRNEVMWYRKHYKEQSDKIEELKKQLEELTSQYQKLTIENKRLQNNVRSGYDQGQTDLWVKLQNVNNSQPFEIATCFPDVTGMEDILSWDLEDFLDAYKKWYEEKEKERLDHMRDYLARFCEGRVCEACPLKSDEFKCGCGYSFRRRDRFDTRIVPDEELERYYKRAWHGDATAEKVKAACDAFAEGLKAGLASEVKEVPVSCDIPIKDLASWECTLEATVEINKDLLEKVCGVKSEEEAHKLEYGDAVRLIWRDYNYMYIGPDEKEGSHVRLFDPKRHAIVTTHIANVRYNGGKIILTSEDDLRMIWKAKK